MAQNQINTVIVLRNDQTTSWESSDHVMLKGEVGIGYLPNGNVIAKLGTYDGINESTKKTWKDLPQIEGVLTEDQILTYNFGRHKLENGSVNAGGAGMTISEWLIDALSEILNPTTNYPTANLKADGYTTDTGTNEIGSKIKAIKWKTETANGAYVGNDGTGTYGSSGGTTNASGISSSNFTWSISNGTDEQTSTASSGTFTLASEDYIQINSTSAANYAYLNGSVTLDASKAYTPKNNVGGLYEAGKITGFDANGTTSKDFENVAIAATGYRDTWQYVGTDYTTTLNSDFFRTARTGLTSKKSNTTSFGTVTIPAGTKRVVFAVLGDKTLKSVIDVDGQNLDVKANFTKETVAIKGANDFNAANYSVFHFENENGVAATKYTVTIG